MTKAFVKRAAGLAVAMLAVGCGQYTQYNPGAPPAGSPTDEGGSSAGATSTATTSVQSVLPANEGSSSPGATPTPTTSVQSYWPTDGASTLPPAAPTTGPPPSFPVPPGAPSGQYHIRTATRDGINLGWIANSNIVTRVDFEGAPTPGTLMMGVGIGWCYWATQTFAVEASTMHPIGSPMHNLMACNEAAVGPTKTDQFEAMLMADISFELVSSDQVTLSGSGLVLVLQAKS